MLATFGDSFRDGLQRLLAPALAAAPGVAALVVAGLAQALFHAFRDFHAGALVQRAGAAERAARPEGREGARGVTLDGQGIGVAVVVDRAPEVGAVRL